MKLVPKEDDEEDDDEEMPKPKRGGVAGWYVQEGGRGFVSALNPSEVSKEEPFEPPTGWVGGYDDNKIMDAIENLGGATGDLSPSTVFKTAVNTAVNSIQNAKAI